MGEGSGRLRDPVSVLLRQTARPGLPGTRATHETEVMCTDICFIPSACLISSSPPQMPGPGSHLSMLLALTGTAALSSENKIEHSEECVSDTE